MAHHPRLPRVEAADFIDERTGWLGGEGAILATTDGGAAWQQQYSGDQRIRRFSFLDRTHGWALGVTELLRTRDGGATWIPLGVREEPLVAVDFIDAQRGWGIVERAREGVPPLRRLARTGDGGATWRVTAIEAQSVCFDDAQAGWLGVGHELWRTTDGGERWGAVFAAPVVRTVPWSATVRCVGGESAYVQFAGAVAGLGNAPYVTYYTADAGRSLMPVFAQGYMGSLYPTVRAPGGAGSYPALISMTAPDRATFVGWSPGPIGVVGVTGAAVRSRGRIAAGSGWLLDADFIDESRGWVVARVNSAPEAVLLATRDGGSTWSPAYPRNTFVPVRAVAPVDAQKAIGIGRLAEPSAVLLTNDGGRAWSAVTSPGEITYARGGPIASFIDADRGWLAGNLRLDATSDGGRTWSDLSIPAEASTPGGTGIGGVVRTGPNTGWMLANGVLYRMGDGTTWAAMPIGDRLGSALACTDGICLATTRHGPPVQLVRYERGSGRVDRIEIAREIAVHTPPSSLFTDGQTLRSASMTAGSQCRDFGLTGCVRVLEPTPDGWREIRIPIAVSFDSGLAWLDTNNGWLTTGQSVYVTSDGGRSWRELP